MSRADTAESPKSIYQILNLVIQLHPINAISHFVPQCREIPRAHRMDRKGFTMSTRLMFMLFSMIATTIIGILITAVLTMGMKTGRAITKTPALD